MSIICKSANGVQIAPEERYVNKKIQKNFRAPEE
jgi:hypothetical protein